MIHASLRLACAVLVGSALVGCDALSGSKKEEDEPERPAATTTTAKEAPSASASAAADDSPEKLQAIIKPKFEWHFKMDELAPKTAPGSLKPLDNGPFSFAADAPTVGIGFDSPEPIRGDIVDHRFMDDLASASTECLLARDATPPLKDEQVAALKKCANFKYFVRVFIRTLVKPEVVGGQFTKGSMSGDVFVFNIDSRAFLGGFSFQATSSDKVEFRNVAGEDVDAVQKDLADNAQNAVSDRWEALTKTRDFPRAK